MPNQYLARSTANAMATPGGGMLVLSPVDSGFLTLNEVAATIWQAADGRTRLADIVEHRICAEFEIDRQIALKDAGEFADKLSRLGVLDVSQHPFKRRLVLIGGSGERQL